MAGHRSLSDVLSGIKYWILDEHHDPIPTDRDSWASWFEDIGNRRVAYTSYGDASVSTVFTGLGERGRVFETLVMGGPLDGTMWVYPTWDEAVTGHVVALAKVVGSES